MNRPSPNPSSSEQDALREALEWKEQHENLLSVRLADIAALTAARDKWVLLAQRTLAYLPSTLGIAKEIRRELPDVLPDTIDTALAALTASPKGQDHE
jgi:hypothetical protein